MFGSARPGAADADAGKQSEEQAENRFHNTLESNKL